MVLSSMNLLIHTSVTKLSMYLSSARSQKEMTSIDLRSHLRIVLEVRRFQRTSIRTVSSDVQLSPESHLAFAATLHFVSGISQNLRRVLKPCSENWPKPSVPTPDE